jgi:outer membrane protein assembly factor BamE (lipoprotein component of BamABCDE complex)
MFILNALGQAAACAWQADGADPPGVEAKMNHLIGSRALMAAALGASLLAAGCAPIRDYRGYVVDEALVAAVQPGIDNRQSVEGTLGRPTFTGQFDDRDWYYVSRNTAQRAFAQPRPEQQTVLHVRFDAAGNVESVNRTGLELVANIRPSSEVTPTLGRNRGFLEELFGNIGAVGTAGAPAGRTSTPDNPQ